jgi:lipopolysaccharide export LptBFGC system permease protein LptF
VINKDVDTLIILEIVGHIAISFLPMAIPLSCMFASMYLYNRMSEDSEIVAMRSFGLRRFDLIKPLLIVGFFIGLMIYGLNDELIPRSKSAFRNQLIRLTSSGMLNDIKAEQFFTEIPGVTLFAEKVSADGSQFENLFIELDKSSGDKNENQTIFATKGALIKQSQGEWDIPLLRLNLKHGNILKINDLDGTVYKILFEEYDFPLASGSIGNHFVAKDSMLSNRELNAERKKISAEIAEETNKERIKYLRNDLTKADVEYWSRLNTPLQCLAFIFLGFVLGIKKGRGKTKNTQGVGLIYLALYYVLFFTGISLTRKIGMDPSIAVFAPTVFLFALCTYYYSRLDWQS